MQHERYDAIVVGAGIVGCSAAYHLARSGLKVAVLDRGSTAGEASQAAAGMLAPLSDVSPDHDHPLEQLGLAALRYYDGLDEQLKQETGVDIGLVDLPMLRLAFDRQEVARLRAMHAEHQTRFPGLVLLDGDGAREIEPLLSPHVHAALLSPYEKNVQAKQLTLAFARGAVSRGAQLVEGCLVERLIVERQRAVGVETANGHLYAEIVVLAAGAWAAQWHLGIYSGPTPSGMPGGPGIFATPTTPIFPMRGQKIVVQALPGLQLRHTVHAVGVGGIVPKSDGTIYVGATVESAGFDAAVTADGLTTLLYALSRLTPGLRHARVLSFGAGLRPGSADGLPLIGPSRSVSGLWIAGGHFRDGILLGPLTGHLIAELIAAHPTPFDLDLAAFNPDRFGGWWNTI